MLGKFPELLCYYIGWYEQRCYSIVGYFRGVLIFVILVVDPGASMWPGTCKGGLSNLAGYAAIHDMTCLSYVEL